MKINLFIPLICFVLLLSSCSRTDNNLGNEEAINVTWSLKSTVGGLAGTNVNFNMGTVLWTFNDSSNTLTVINNNTNDDVYDGLETGSYSYTMTTIDGLEYLIVNEDYNLGRLEYINSELTLDNGIPLDGLLLTFEIYIP